MTAAVVRKELATLWASSLPYVVGAAFHAVLGVLLVDQLAARAQAVLQPLFPIAGFLLLLAVPVLTMRTFAEEARTGTLDVLLAASVPPRPLVAGKWLAAWLSALAVLAPAGLVVVLVEQWGSPDRGPAVSGFLGLVLLAAAVAGVGVLASSLTSSQPVAAMTSVSAVLVLWFADAGAGLRTGGGLGSVSLSARLRGFADGAVDSADVAFFLTLAVASLVVAALAVDARRLR